MYTKVLINSIDVTSTLKNYEYERAFGDTTNEINLEFNILINRLLTLQTGQTVYITRGWVTATDEVIFNGYVQTISTDAGTVKILAQDKMWDLVRKEVNVVYDANISPSAGVISEVFKDLVTTYGGLNADNTTIQNSGTDYVLDKFVCIHTDVFERCKALADALDWQFYYRADTDKVYFEMKGFTSNSTTLTVGDNIYGIPQWKYDITEMVNDLYIVGASQLVETTESGKVGTTSGYTTTEIGINYTPTSVKVYADTLNPPTTLREGGVPGSSTNYYYSVDKDNKKILPAEATTFTNNYYFEIRYSRAVPIPVHQTNPSSITTYGIFTKTITYEDLRSVDDAINRGTYYLLRYSTPFIYTTLKVKSDPTYDLRVGQLISVIDNVSSPAISSRLLINKHRIRYPADYDELEVGDKQWRLAEFNSKVLEAIKRLNEKEYQNQDILTELVNVDNTLTFPITVKPRYQYLMTNTIIGTDLFILGNNTVGILGTSKLGNTNGFGPDTLHIVQQYQNIYTEKFIDIDFKDAGNTSATWTNLGYLEMI